MSAARIIESMGAAVAMVDGKVRLSGLNGLDREAAARVLEVARAHRDELVAELMGGGEAPPDQSGHDLALAELDRFFSTAAPDGEGGWSDTVYLERLRLGRTPGWNEPSGRILSVGADKCKGRGARRDFGANLSLPCENGS